MADNQATRCGETVLLRVPEAAKMLGLGRSKAYEMAKLGVLPIVRIGTAIRVPCEALFEWVQARTQHART
jgi:excisionase family DNA binding protein